MFHAATVEPVLHAHPRRKEVAPSQDDRERLRTVYCVDEVVDYLLSQTFCKVAVQLPDDLLGDAVRLLQLLEERLTQHSSYEALRGRLAQRHAPAEEKEGGTGETDPLLKLASPAARKAAATTKLDNPNAPSTEVRFYVLADNTFGSCCPDEITAAHYGSEVIVHYGNACYSRNTRIPVYYVHPPFELKVVVTGQKAQPMTSSDATYCGGEVVARVLEHLYHTLLQKCSSYQDGKEASISVELVVMASHSAQRLLQAAKGSFEQRVDLASGGGGGKVTLHWCPTEVQTALTEHDSKESTEEWRLNGIRIPRRTVDDPNCVSLYLAILPQSTVRIVSANLQGVLQYNHCHYTEEASSLLEHLLEKDDDALSLSELMILDETFGVDHAPPLHLQGEKEKDAAAIQAWGSSLFSSHTASLSPAALGEGWQLYTKRQRQREFNVEAVRQASAVGILLATLSTQYYYETALQLFQLCRLYKKRAYMIYVGHVNEYKIANFVDAVDLFVVVACPHSEECHYNDKKKYNFMKPIVSPMEVILALTTEEYEEDEGRRRAFYGKPSVYANTLLELQAELAEAVQEKEKQLVAQEAQTTKDHPTSHSLVTVDPQTALITPNYQDIIGDSLARFQERDYKGLRPEVGETPVQATIEKGKHGIARGYTDGEGVK